jgi:hypothetical protein
MSRKPAVVAVTLLLALAAPGCGQPGAADSCIGYAPPPGA